MVPSINGCINFIANTIAGLPIKLYEEIDGKVMPIMDDRRVALLNDDPGDTLDAVQMRRAIVEDYFLGKGGFIYIEKQRNEVISLRYVDEESVSINKNTDPIFKNYDILVNGKEYKYFDFIKVLRKTKDGSRSKSILEESPLMIILAYNTLNYENNLVSTGGNKKGFLKTTKKLGQDAINLLKAAWRSLYSNNDENVVILNDGLEFQEASNTSVEMQLNEKKKTLASEICQLFGVPEKIILGGASSQDYSNGFKAAVLPVLSALECAINRDLLLEKEKSTRYFAFDTKEVTKGDIKARYEAYKLGIESNFLQIDEVRYMEDLPALGLKWIKLGLDSVLYDPDEKAFYTPNTNQTTKFEKGGKSGESGKSGVTVYVSMAM